MEYSRVALGQVIRDLREAHAPRLSQEELGRRAGYRTGAGVSMSRIENGVTRPGPRRLAGIATTLGLTVHELELRSAERTTSSTPTDGRPARNRDATPARESTGSTTGATKESTKDRMRRIQGDFGRRQAQAVAQGQAFNSAHDRARDDYFLELLESARGITGLPASPGRLRPDPAERSGPAAEAALRHRVAVDGLTALLASGVTGRVVANEPDGEAAYNAVVAAAMLAPTPTDRPDADPWARATARATRALIGGGTTVSGRTGIAASVILLGGFVASAASPLVAASTLAWVARRSRQQNELLRAELDQAEANLVSTQAGFDAVMDLLAEATELLGYIAVHASHAQRRWRVTLPTGTVAWSELSGDQQGAYATFVDIAAHQVCVDSINATELLAAAPDQQASLIQGAGAILTAARRDVELLV
ncbi:MAG TPA: helix-turn-helix transcriptional regulator [Lapillicoccus sp.]|nr:helix-turn-helix transcriptional regulator [Lapillicoccus sp.]